MTGENWKSSLTPLGWLLIALVILWPITLHPAFIAMPPRGQFSDLLITHWPGSVMLRRSLAEFHQLPLWNPSILAGQPFAADPLASVWYPPNWLTLVLPLPLAFNLLFGLHLAWAGWGMFRFLSDSGLPSGPAILGGMAFAGTPKLMAHLGAGHVTLVYAVAWTPWLLLAVRRSVTGRARHAAPAGAVMALLTLADVRWAAHAGAVAVGYLVLLSVRGAAGDGRRGLPARVLVMLTRLASFAGVAFLLSAILLIPLFEFLGHTPRIALTAGDVGELSLPLRYLVGLVIPDFGGYHEWMTYLGFLPLALAALAILARPAGQAHEIWYWACAALAAAAFSLGTTTPVFGLLLRSVPGLSLLRVPPRAWFVVALAVAVLAAYGVDRLTQPQPPRMRKTITLAAFGLSAFALALAVAVSTVLSRPAWSLMAFGVVASLGLGVISWQAHGRLSQPAFIALAGFITLADLSLTGGTLMAMRAPATQFEAYRPLAEYLKSNSNGARIYSPSYSLPQPVAAQYGLELADGVNPLQLADTVAFMSSATGVPARSYSVTLPPLDGDPATANAGATPDTHLLGLLNVGYVVAQFPVVAEGLVERARFGQAYVYENSLARPRAWMEPELTSASSAVVIPVPGVELTPNRIVVDADAIHPSILVLSEISYPGWQVQVDGQPAQIIRVHGLLRGVQLEPGTHRAVFEFRPTSVYAGAAVTMIGLMALAWVWVADRSRGRTGRRQG